MNEETLQTVNITMGQNVYSTFESLPNTVSHALADFIDNSLQSYRDHKELLNSIEKDFKLKIEIKIDWDSESGRALKICIEDNAAGINILRYQKSFMPAIKPTDDTGLNEFGMGLKTAACWFGNIWSVRTKALNEINERTINFNLNEVTANDLKQVPVINIEKDILEHYTILTISELTKNAPYFRSITTIKNELSSIYRKSFRENEMSLIFCGEQITFTEYEILTAPFVRAPNGPPIYWKKEIDFKFGKYKANGFIGILKNMNKDHNRIVLLRRGRVIIGAESEGHYYSKTISGQSGSPRDKRIFGELELDGFDVAFNKNDIQDKENLDALLEALLNEIHSKEFDLTTQAQEYREDERHKQIKKIITKHNSSPKEKRLAIEIDTTNIGLLNTKEESASNYKSPEGVDSVQISQKQPSVIIGEYEDSYKIDGKDYTLNVQFVDDKGNHDLFWVDVSKEDDFIITCKINSSHIFFEHFGKPSDSNVAILKIFAVAKYIARRTGTNSATDLFNVFNEYISKTKV